MKVIAVFAAVLAVSSAQWINNFGYSGLGFHGHLGYAAAPVVAAAPVAVAPVATKTQYHAQDELGQASFGHSEPGQAHSAVRDAAGGVRGTFSYISPEGIPFTTHYVADHNGYRVASNALPVAPSVSLAGPIDTPEVQAAKAQHAAAHADALIRSGRRKRGAVLPIGTIGTTGVVSQVAHTPAATQLTATQVVAAPAAVTYAAAPVAHHVAYNSHVVSAPAVTYAHHVAAPVSAAAVTYTAAAPAVAYGSHVVHNAAVAPAVTYSHVAAAPAVVANHANVVTYAAAPAATLISSPAVRAATLTKVVNTPGHAVSYRVD